MISAPPASRRVLVFAVAGRTRCCELDQVREIVPISATTRLPGAQLFDRGLINLRGNLVTVLDAAMSLYGVSGDDPSASILLVERGNGVAGVVVDKVFDIQSLPNVDVNGGALLDLRAMVSRRDVERYMKQQIETVVFDLFSWKEGTFSFTDRGVDSAGFDAAVRVSTESLLMEGARRIDEWSRMADRIPDAHAVPHLAAIVHGSESFIDLRPGEWEVLALIDGQNTLLYIASSLAVSEFEVARTVYGMISTELIEVVGRTQSVA